jgi:hypothetical protein
MHDVCVLGCGQALAPGERVRIVEVGSGSGGTSVVVMEALADLGERVEFVYTDISLQLVAYGRRTYGPRFSFARFRPLDVERDVAAQVRRLCQIRLLTEPHHIVSRFREALQPSVWRAESSNSHPL